MTKRRRSKKGRSGGGGLLPLTIVMVAVAAVFYALYAREVPENATAQPGIEAVSDEDAFASHYIDVGQGDSTLIVCGGESMLIDAGETGYGAVVTEYIRSLGITELTYVVATHPHSDHIGGLPAVLDAFPVKSFITADITHTTKTFENLLDALERNNLDITLAKPRDEYMLGNARLTILSPSGKKHEELNNYSVVLRADYGDVSYMFTGDAESEAEKEMAEAGLPLKSDVLKVGHHGSRSSTTSAFLSAVSPRYAVISCGLDNSYGHPHSQTIDELNNYGVETYQTQLSGNIVIRSDGKGFEVETER